MTPKYFIYHYAAKWVEQNMQKLEKFEQYEI